MSFYEFVMHLNVFQILSIFSKFSEPDFNTISMDFNAIYIVDPDLSFHSTIKKFASKVDVNTPIFYFTDGEEFLTEYLKSNHTSPNNQPSLILLDLNTESGHGWAFLKKFEGLDYPIRSNFQIVTLSNELSLPERNQALAYQSVSFYFHKPLTFRGFSTMVEMIVKDFSSSV